MKTIKKYIEETGIGVLVMVMIAGCMLAYGFANPPQPDHKAHPIARVQVLGSTRQCWTQNLESLPVGSAGSMVEEYDDMNLYSESMNGTPVIVIRTIMCHTAQEDENEDDTDELPVHHVANVTE